MIIAFIDMLALVTMLEIGRYEMDFTLLCSFSVKSITEAVSH